VHLKFTTVALFILEEEERRRHLPKWAYAIWQWEVSITNSLIRLAGAWKMKPGIRGFGAGLN